MSNRGRSPCKKNRNVTVRWLLIITLLLSMALVLNACQEEDPTPEAAQLPAEEATEVPPTEVPPEPTEVPPTDVPPTEVPPTEVPPEPTEEPPPPPPDQSAIVAAWEGSPHGNTYDLGKGPNTYCSRCHSPQNWDPASTTGPPPNCVTCKFAHEEEMREAPTMAFVAEEDWIGITCETCHVMENETATTIAWLNTRNNEHEQVNTPNEICEKCHVTSSGVSWTGGTGVEHGIILGGSAHKNWAGILDDERRPEYCSECHDPHTQQPTLCVDCHGEVLTLDTHIMGNNEMHENVACMACHDASGAEVGPHPDEEMGGMFTTVLSSIGRDGSPSLEPIISHSVQWQVACDRCHFTENPWELLELTADGEIPSEEEGGQPSG